MKPRDLRSARAKAGRPSLYSPRVRPVLTLGVISLLLMLAGEAQGSEPAAGDRVRGVSPFAPNGGQERFEGSANAAAFEWEVFREAAAAGGLAALPAKAAGEGATVYIAHRASREETITADLCAPHRSLEFHILKRERSVVQSLADLRRKRIVVVTGSEVVPFLEELGFEEQLLRAPTIQGVAGLLASGKVEVAVVDRFALRAEFTEAALRGLELLPGSVYTVSCGFAVDSGNDKVRLALEKGLGTIKRDGRYQRIEDEHLSYSEGRQAPGVFATLYRYVGWLILPLGLLFLAVSMVALSLRQRAMEKILNLQEEIMEEKIRLARVRDDAAKSRFVLNQLSTVSLVDQLLESSGSRREEATTE